MVREYKKAPPALKFLYITQNGVTTHIGRSQVAPYILGLARLGFKIHILSAEPPNSKELIDYYQKLFFAVGILWTTIPYLNRPSIVGPLLTQFRLLQAAHQIVNDEKIFATHCRSFPAALIGYRLKKKYGIKFIFDFRDFYADWGLRNTTGIKRLLYVHMKQLEGPMIRSADRVVCLTKRAANLLTEWYLSDHATPAIVFQVIPCCADFSHFDVSQTSSNQIKLLRNQINIEDDALVMVYLGSLSADYLLSQMITLFKCLLKERNKAYFLFVSNTGHNLVKKECKTQDLNPAHVRFVTASREEVPLYLACATISVIFIQPGLTKVGCSPTKLAELFACNIPVIANADVGDLDSIIDPLINGSVVVSDFSETTMQNALERVFQLKKKNINIRENSRHFALTAGVDLYAEVYRELLNNSSHLENNVLAADVN